MKILEKPPRPSLSFKKHNKDVNLPDIPPWFENPSDQYEELPSCDNDYPYE